MAAGAALWRLNFPIMNKLLCRLQTLGALVGQTLGIEIENVLRVAEPLLGIAVTLDAERHA